MIQKLFMIIIILAVVLGGGYYAYQELVPPPETEAQGPVYATQPVERGDITVGVETSGSLNPSYGGGIQVPFFKEAGGQFNFTINEVFVKEGDQVSQGQVVAVLNAPDLKTQIESLEADIKSERESLANLMNISPDQVEQIDPSRGITIRAPIDGRVMGLTLNEGQELKQGQIIASLVNDSKFYLTAKLTPGEFSQVKEEQLVALRFSAFSSLVDGKITKINSNPVPEPASNLHDTIVVGKSSGNDDLQLIHWVTIEGENPGLVRPEMLAQVGILKEEVDEVSKASALEARWLRYYAEVEGYVDEEKILNTADESIVTQVHVQEMETLKQGDPVITLAGEDTRTTLEEKLDKIRQKKRDLQQIQNQLGQLEITSPMDGVVAYLDLQPGRMVRPGEHLGSIYNTSEMRMWVDIDDIDIPLVQQNAPVDITVPAFPGKTLEGKVQRISPMGQDRNGIQKFRVDILVTGIPELRPGMQAQAYIDAGSAKDVLLVPLEAIFEEDGQPKVEMLGEEGMPKIVSVELGLMNDRFAEIKSGLEEGQEVITGSSADLLPSQSIGTQDRLLPGNSGEEEGQIDAGNGSIQPSTEGTK